MRRCMDNKDLSMMTEAYQYKSRFYFTGESPAERIVYWEIFKEAWMMAKEAYKEDTK